MKIIFESKEEMDDFVGGGFCPSNIGLKDTCEIEQCAECWKEVILKAGVVNKSKE